MPTRTKNENIFKSLLKVHLGMAELSAQGLMSDDASNSIAESVLVSAGIDIDDWNEWVQN